MVERKIRLAANTNNTETLTRLLQSGVADVNVGDEHRRTALHFAAAKVVSKLRLYSGLGANDFPLAAFIEKYTKPVQGTMSNGQQS